MKLVPIKIEQCDIDRSEWELFCRRERSRSCPIALALERVGLIMCVGPSYVAGSSGIRFNMSDDARYFVECVDRHYGRPPPQPCTVHIEVQS